MSERLSNEDRRRVVHHLVRKYVIRSDDGAFEHLTLDELAAFVGDSLLRSESTRVENHLLSCRRCREVATRLHAEFEAGVVPYFLRGSSESTAGRTVVGRWPKRVAPWLLAAAVFVAVVVIPASLDRFLNRGTLHFDTDMWVLSRVGTPVLGANGETPRTPAKAGTWIDSGTAIYFEPGDTLLVLAHGGTVRRISRGGADPVHDGSELLGRLFNGVRARRGDLAAVLDSTPADVSAAQTGKGVTILHPISTILDTTPAVRWTDDIAGRQYRVQLRRRPTEEVCWVRDVSERKCRFPETTRPLEAGVEYRVDIFVEPFDSTPEGSQDFVVLGGERRNQVQGDLSGIAGLLRRDGNLLEAEYLCLNGLFSEAALELETLARADGDNVHVLVRLKSVYADLGLHHESFNVGKLIEKRGLVD